MYFNFKTFANHWQILLEQGRKLSLRDLHNEATLHFCKTLDQQENASDLILQ